MNRFLLHGFSPRLAAFFSVLLIGGECLGEISSVLTVVEKTFGKGEKEAVYSFTLENPGKLPVAITSVTAACPCVTIVDSPESIKAGGEAGITVLFRPDPAGGVQTQQIQVISGESKEPLVLTLRATLPIIASAEPKFLFWKKDERASSLNVKLTIPSEGGAKFIQAYAMDENFFTRTTILDGGAIQIEVTPRDTGIGRPALVMIELSIPDRIEPLRLAVPCQIADRNPFEINFGPPSREITPDGAALQKTLEQFDGSGNSKPANPILPPVKLPTAE